jgi:hypothetical protein
MDKEPKLETELFYDTFDPNKLKNILVLFGLNIFFLLIVAMIIWRLF